MEDKRRSLAGLACNLNLPAVFLDDPVAQGKAQSRPFSLLLGREEGLEYAILKLGGDAGAGVRHARLNPLTDAASRDANAPSTAHFEHRLFGIVQQIDEHLLDLMKVEHRHG